MSDTVMTGIAIVSACALVGIIGVLANTQKYPGLKWALFFLIIAGAAAGVNREFQTEAAAKVEKKRADEALKLANESSRLVENGLMKQAQAEVKFTEHREQLEADIKAQQKLQENLVEQIVALSAALEEMSGAAEKAKKKDIAAMGTKARLDASKTLLALARKENWLKEKELAKMASGLRKKEPLTAADLKVVQAKMTSSHLKNAE